MATEEPSLGLSDRGHTLASGSDTSQVFELLRNLYHPDDNPNGIVSLGVAENDCMHDTLTAYIEKTFKLPNQYLTYLDGGAGSRRLTSAIARFLNRHLKPFKPIQKEHIVVTNGTSAAIENISYSLTDPGDGLLLGRPYYRAFLPDLETRTGAEVIKVSFGVIDPFSLEAVACYEDAILQSQARKQTVKGLVLCHPHNPLGRCYPKEVIIALMKLCQKYRLHLISDEIYALSLWDNTEDSTPAPVPYVSALSIDTTGIIDPHLVHFVWGMSKDFGANGLRVGCLISPDNPGLVTALATLSLYTYPSNLADHVTSVILEDDAFTDAYIAENQAKLSSRFSLAARFLTRHGIAYAPGANAAFFICADLGRAYLARHPDVADEKDLTGLLVRKLMEKKVFIVDSDAIGSEKPGWFRIVFSQNETSLMEGLRRIVAAIDDGSSKDASKRESGLSLRPKIGDGQENPVGGLAT